MQKETKLFIASGICALICGTMFYWNSSLHKKEIKSLQEKIPHVDTIKVKDTVRIIVEGKIKYKNKYLIKQDTIYLPQGQLLQYVELDTIFTYDTLHVIYEFPPSNIWNISLRHTPQIITKTNTIHDTSKIYIRPARRWFERFDIGPTLAVGLGTRGFDVFMGIGIQYGLW